MITLHRVAIAFVVSSALGCDCGGPRTGNDGSDDSDRCSDLDGDGYGVGAGCLGPDCNDFVADIHLDEQCAAFCEEHEISPGCPCDAVEPAVCYAGPPETLDVADCKQGITACRDGFWGACEGEVLPTDEVCDEQDDDCDGAVDDGLLSECGTCGECQHECIGPDPDCDDWGDLPPHSIVETPEGWLTLDADAVSAHVLWPSSSETAEIFRVNTQTLAVEGVFFTGPNHSIGGAFGGGDSPSRTAVDDSGNVIVANRTFFAQPSITKIAGDPDTCPDVNGDGDVDTSHTWYDRHPFTSHEDWDDECILWHTEIGNPDGIARALSIHSEPFLDGPVERGWVGLFNELRFLQFDTATGELTGKEVATPDCMPYGAAIDHDGWLWATCSSNAVSRFDTADPEDSLDTLHIHGDVSLRVIVDENNAPWISGAELYRWSRKTDEFDPVGIGGPWGGLESVRIGPPASDGHGSVWVGAFGDDPWVWRVENDADLGFHKILTPGVLTFGTAVDFDGHVWAFDYENGRAAVIDIETEAVQVALEDCDGPCLNLPYVRGDATGMQRRNAQKPTGKWTHVFEGCEDDETNWARALVDAVAPAGTRVAVLARTAASLVELAATPWVLLGSADGAAEFNLDEALGAEGDGPLLELAVVLESEDRTQAPVLRRVEVQWGCDTTID